MPYATRVGVSRKIESREQRAKLREMVSRLLPKDSGGVIVRTVAEGVTEEHFRREIQSLLGTWKKIKRKQTYVRRAPALLHREASLTRSLVRDVFSAKVDALWVDSRELYHEMTQYLEAIDPGAAGAGALLRRPRAAVRPVQDRAGDPRPLQAAGRPPHRRVHHHPADRGADLDRRQHRALHRQARPGEDDPPHQHRGGAGDRAADPAARRRRHHRRRLHRHGVEGQSRSGPPGTAHPPGPRPGADPGVRRFGTGPDRDDPATGPPVALGVDDPRVPHLRRAPAGSSRRRSSPGAWSGRSSGRARSTRSAGWPSGCTPRWRSTSSRRSRSWCRRSASRAGSNSRSATTRCCGSTNSG